MEGVIFGPDAYCYRCPFGLEYPDCGIVCADYIEYMIKHESNVAAVIVEPIVGANGVIVPPDEYLPRLREITEQNGVLLICDEVMTGWGRIGEWFAVNHWKVKPDILTTAKGITGPIFRSVLLPQHAKFPTTSRTITSRTVIRTKPTL